MNDSILVLGSAAGRNWTIYNADCVEASRQMPDRCVDLALFSPPFSHLYTYSDSPRDQGNVASDAEFIEQHRHVVRELFRVIKPGRLCVVHCKELVDYMGRDGESGIRDFPGELIRLYQSEGFKFHSRVTVWTSAPDEMKRTNAHGLLYKTFRLNATYTRCGLPEYVLVFRRWPKNAEEEAMEVPILHDPNTFTLDWWQEAASPVWMTVRRTNVLNVALGREDKDERHMCPLQLDIIERAIALWSNPNEVVFTPFLGVGSELVGALRLGRKGIGTELKESYFRQAAKFLTEEESSEGKQAALFGMAAK